MTAMADAQQISPLKSAANQSHAAAGIAERIISASPILEAFGNAQTLRNPNSSRFGKWMVLNFNSANRIIAAHIVSYLLEKSRVTKRDLCERNYHIFYQLLRGADEEMLQSCRLVRDTKSYHYLLGEANYLKDSECYAETHEAFLKMGFSEEDVKEVFKIIGAILIIGNIEFKPIRDGEAADFVSEKELETAAEMLSLKSTLLKYSLKNRSIESGKVRRSLITIQLNVQKATETRDTLARTLYDNLFHDIISGINKNSDSGAGEYVDRCIGLLDIFGFEIFVDNSFEQLCINYCNEMLQNHFNYVVFTSEKSLYAAESITCDTIEFKDNIETIKEIQAVFKSLDEEGRIPRGSSKAWYDKMKRNAKYSHISYPNKKDVFVVQHYAGDVAYEPLGFMEKNVETLSNDLVSTMLSSTDLTVKRIFSSSEPESPKSDSGKVAAHSSLSVKSISWKFQEQLQALTKMLNQTESHFIRCIKSNEPCRPFKFDSVLVHRQLLYSGVFEVVKIQQSGLPCRIKHHEFIDRYKCLVPSRLRYNLKSPNELIRQLRESKLDVSHVQVGNTMTFFKGLEQRLLDTKKEDLLDMSATRIQKWIRMKTRQGIYRSLIVYYRSFWQFNDNLILAPAEEQYALLRNVVESLHRIDRYDVLGKMLSNLEFELSVLEQRAHLLEQAETLLEERTESSILAMNVVLSRAIELALTTHTTIRKCKDYTQHFYRALEFITFVNSPEKINSLSLYNLTEGITDMETFGDIIPDAQAAKTLAEQHKNVVVHELHDIYEPLQEALEKASLVFDEDSGDLHLKYPDEDSSVRAGVSDSYYIKLKGLVEACGERTFHSFDLEELHLDCKHFLRLREDYLGVVDANGAIEFISNCVTHNSVFLDQMEQFKLWADIQRSPVALRAALMVGWVARTQIGGESEVEIEKLVEVVEKVGRLKNPSEQLIRVMRVGNWMIKVRYC